VNIVHAQNKDLPEFIEFAWSIYSNDPLWIPPLRESLLRELSGASAISRRWRIQPFLCKIDGAVRGRIAALINPTLIDRDGVPIGQLGYFECVDDPRIAEALVDAGIEWLRKQGAQEVLAPINGGAHRLYRLLVCGFDRTPFLFEPRNPAYYPRLFEHCRLEPRCRWFSYDLNLEEMRQIHERLRRILVKHPARGEIVALQPNLVKETAARLHAILDDCWSGHIAYAPMEFEEMTEMFAGLLSIMGPYDLSVYVEDHRDAGLAFMYPDYAAEVRSLGGDAARWGEWLGKSRAKRLVVSTSALIPEARKSSAAVAQIVGPLGLALQDGFEEFVVALVIEGWMSRIAVPTREYVLYGRSLG
jgi:hypothetical protein